MRLPKRFRRKPRITEDNYGKLMTSFGRVVDRDRYVAQPAQALADRVIEENPQTVEELDAHMYQGSAEYHLRLLAGSWIMAQEGSVPRETAEIFEEAVAWKFGPIVNGSDELSHRLSDLARGDVERSTQLPDEFEG